MGLAPGGGLMMAGTMLAFAGVCTMLVRVFEIPDYGVLFIVAFGIFLLEESSVGSLGRTVLGLGMIQLRPRHNTPRAFKPRMRH